MQILVTGSNGFLGKTIFDFLKINHSVYGLSRTNSLYNVDLSISSPLFSNNFDLVVHCAGRAHITNSTKDDIVLFNQVNVGGTYNLLNSLSHRPPNRFLYISSVSVYGLDEAINVDESYPLNAKDPYGLSKIESEKLVLDWCNTNNILCTIFRLPLIVGENAPGNLGNMIKGIQNGYYFNIAGGRAKKSMVLASDVAEFVIRASKIGGIFNLTDQYHPSFKELSLLIANQMGKKSILNIPYWLAIIIARIGDNFGKNFIFNSNKLKKINSNLTFSDDFASDSFGWKPTQVLINFNLNK